MARKNDVRGTVKLRSTAGTGYTYMTSKNRRNTRIGSCPASSIRALAPSSSSARSADGEDLEDRR